MLNRLTHPRLVPVLALLALLLAGCSSAAKPTRTPRPRLENVATAVPTRTRTAPAPAGVTATALAPAPQPTRTAMPAATTGPVLGPTSVAKSVLTPALAPTALTAVPLPKLNVLLQVCDTGLDVFNGLGEVTNAYVVVQNPGDVEATQVQVVLTASDEEKAHPDKRYLIQNLPPGYEMALKLTVDTRNGADTALTATVTTAEGVTEQASKSACRQRRPDRTLLDAIGELFSLRKMPQP